jgi:hypothetical protein
MVAYEAKTGGRVLAIPHNGNLSNGLMFDDLTLTGNKPLDRDYAERRSRWEPVYEVTQMKGDGEAHPSLSPNDEFADYGTWDKGSFGPEPKTPDMLPREYAREALKRGLKYEQALGANPFKFGMIGSTDTHTSLATTEENNYFGKATPAEPSASPERFQEKITGFLQQPGGQDITTRHYQTLASGLVAVWATDNKRAALWDALARKEVYATTGTRMTVRIFAGWDFEPAEVQRPDFAKAGYERGVPMGGDLRKAPNGKSPTFMIRALRDVDGANLDRVQIIKGWVDNKGELHEQVYDVMCSDQRAINDKHRCDKPVGNTVDIEQATYTNSIGDALIWRIGRTRHSTPISARSITCACWRSRRRAGPPTTRPFSAMHCPKACRRHSRNARILRRSGTCPAKADAGAGPVYSRRTMMAHRNQFKSLATTALVMTSASPLPCRSPELRRILSAVDSPETAS